MVPPSRREVRIRSSRLYRLGYAAFFAFGGLSVYVLAAWAILAYGWEPPGRVGANVLFVVAGLAMGGYLWVVLRWSPIRAADSGG